MICKASILSVIYVVNVTQNAELFCPQKTSVFRKCGVFCLPQMRKMKKKTKKKNKQNVGSTARTRDLNFAVHRSNHYSIPPSLERKLKLAYIKKLKIFFSSQKKNYKITFVGITDEILWAKFGDPVTSIFVKNSQKRKNYFF